MQVKITFNTVHAQSKLSFYQRFLLLPNLSRIEQKKLQYFSSYNLWNRFKKMVIRNTCNCSSEKWIMQIVNIKCYFACLARNFKWTQSVDKKWKHVLDTVSMTWCQNTGIHDVTLSCTWSKHWNQTQEVKFANLNLSQKIQMLFLIITWQNARDVAEQ